MKSRIILVVDDEPEERTIFASYLRFVGATTLEASNGEEGLRIAREAQPDLILMDITMPVLDGWGTMEQLHASPETADIPVLAVTAHRLDADRLEQAGFCGYLEKPISPHRVLEEVERCVGRLAGTDDEADGDLAGASHQRGALSLGAATLGLVGETSPPA